MRFSHRVDIDEPNPIAKAEAALKAQGVRLRALNDSNPTRHGLAPSSLPEAYAADPRGQRYAREAIAAYINASVNAAGSGAITGTSGHDDVTGSGDVTSNGGGDDISGDEMLTGSSGIDDSTGGDGGNANGGESAARNNAAHSGDTTGNGAATCNRANGDSSGAAYNGALGDEGPTSGMGVARNNAARDGDAACGSAAGSGGAGAEATAQDVYLLSSTSQAYAWLMKLLCDAGDAILAPKPGYPLIESIARLECVKTQCYQLRFDGSWFIDVPQIARMLDEDTARRIRALVVINPNNPTGSYVKPSEREALVELCIRYGIAIIADEVFFDYPLEPFAGNRRFSGESRVLTFALDGFSKTLAAPHAKVGWIRVSGPAADVREARRRLDVIADDFLPMSEFVAREVPGMLREAPRQLAAVGERVRANLAVLHRMLDADVLGVVDVLRAEGGWNVLLRFPGVIDENDLVLSMIDTARTSGQPGYFFDMTSNGYLAISLLPVTGIFEEHVRIVLDAVRQRLDNR